MDHHDDWTHWTPEEPDPHGGHDGLDPLGGHDGLDPFAEHGIDPVHHDDLPLHDDLPAHDVDQPDLRHDADLHDADLHDADLADEPGHGPTEPGPSIMDGPGAAEAGVDAHLFGVDHDLPPGGAQPVDFPPPLDLPDRPDPVDGYPWSDVDLLGDPGTAADWPGYVHAVPDAADLLSYAGIDTPGTGEDPWAALLGADDPAAAALARWWGPLS